MTSTGKPLQSQWELPENYQANCSYTQLISQNNATIYLRRNISTHILKSTQNNIATCVSTIQNYTNMNYIENQ